MPFESLTKNIYVSNYMITLLFPLVHRDLFFFSCYRSFHLQLSLRNFNWNSPLSDLDMMHGVGDKLNCHVLINSKQVNSFVFLDISCTQINDIYPFSTSALIRRRHFQLFRGVVQESSRLIFLSTSLYLTLQLKTL